jgi:hypothetical protein
MTNAEVLPAGGPAKLAVDQEDKQDQPPAGAGGEQPRSKTLMENPGVISLSIAMLGIVMTITIVYFSNVNSRVDAFAKEIAELNARLARSGLELNSTLNQMNTTALRVGEQTNASVLRMGENVNALGAGVNTVREGLTILGAKLERDIETGTKQTQEIKDSIIRSQQGITDTIDKKLSNFDGAKPYEHKVVESFGFIPDDDTRIRLHFGQIVILTSNEKRTTQLQSRGFRRLYSIPGEDPRNPTIAFLLPRPRR